MVFQAGGHRVREAGATIEERGPQAERQLLTAADQEHVVYVGVEPFRDIGREHNRRATGPLPLLEQAEKAPSPEDVEGGGDLVGNDEVGPTWPAPR